MHAWGWVVALAIGAGCAGRARPTAPPPRGLAPSMAAAVAAPVAVAPVARAPVAATPVTPAPVRRHDDGVGALPLGDRAVVRALSQAQPSFLRCYRRAQRVDPGLVRATVTVAGRLSPAGQLEEARVDAPTAAFGACVVAVARALRFERPTAPTRVVLPLRFAAP